MACRDFSAERMVSDYSTKFYVPAIDANRNLRSDDFQKTKSIALWKNNIQANWNQISIVEVETPSMEISPKVGETIPATIKVDLGEISPDDVTVEVIAGNLNSLEQMDNYEPVTALRIEEESGNPKGQHVYKTEVTCKESGRFGVAVRVMPHNEHLHHNKIPRLIKWW
jgi:starch phosphorylase